MESIFIVLGARFITMSYQGVISINKDKRGGKHCIRDLRISVYDVLGWLASGMSQEQIMDDHPDLNEEDIRACLSYAADRERVLASA